MVRENPEPNTTDAGGIPDELMCHVVSTVLQLRLAEPTTAPSVELSNWADLELDALGVDSLGIAEIVVGLEQRLGVLLELSAGSGLGTLGQLRAALQPADAT